MHTFMDAVQYNAVGNEVKLIKRRKTANREGPELSDSRVTVTEPEFTGIEEK